MKKVIIANLTLLFLSFILKSLYNNELVKVLYVGSNNIKLGLFNAYIDLQPDVQVLIPNYSSYILLFAFFLNVFFLINSIRPNK